MSTESEMDDFEAAFGEASSEEVIENLADVDAQDEPEEHNEPEEVTLEDRLAELERERDDYRQKFQSNNGRISAYQRQVEELNHKLTSQVDSAAQGNTHAQAQDQLAQDLNGSSWDELLEDMPEVAEAINQRLNSVVEDRLSQIEHKISPLTERVQQDAQEAQIAALKSRHPDFQEIANSNEFDNWIADQPDFIQAKRHSNDAADAAYVLDSYKAMTGANQTRNKNRSRLESNVAAPSKRIARAGDDMDFESAFNARVNSKRRG
jgi:predicted  nucleic acid-binding Zn-ribbon protein